MQLNICLDRDPNCSACSVLKNYEAWNNKREPDVLKIEIDPVCVHLSVDDRSSKSIHVVSLNSSLPEVLFIDIFAWNCTKFDSLRN